MEWPFESMIYVFVFLSNTNPHIYTQLFISCSEAVQAGWDQTAALTYQLSLSRRKSCSLDLHMSTQTQLETQLQSECHGPPQNFNWAYQTHAGQHTSHRTEIYVKIDKRVMNLCLCWSFVNSLCNFSCTWVIPFFHNIIKFCQKHNLSVLSQFPFFLNC